MIKKAYMQGEIEVEPPPEGEDAEEEHSTSPRNVGHNIYILAHQVSDTTGGAQSEGNISFILRYQSEMQPGLCEQ